ncbi:MAG: pseudaminic acid synthase [Thermoguttaceae bacterium]|jgi:N-acetylneuraminate synthase
MSTPASPDRKYSIRVGNRRICGGVPPFVIAEMSGNHNQSLDRALKIVQAAADAGADAIKLQTYTADTITLDVGGGSFVISDPQSPWAGKRLHDLYQEAYTPWEWHKPLFDRARELGLVAFSTPFDATAVDFLEALDVPAYKVASFELVDLALVERIAGTGKPMIVSTGMATLSEIGEAVEAARRAGATEIALLKCSSAYPAQPEEMNLATIPHLAEAFGVPVGLSDHTLGIAVPVAAVALGACIVEKHLTLSRSEPGPDAAFSLEPAEFRAMVEAVRTAQQAVGRVDYGVSPREAASRAFRRSLFVAQDVREGDVFTPENVRSVRPADGLPPKFLPEVLGRRAARDIQAGTPLKWELIA